MFREGEEHKPINPWIYRSVRLGQREQQQQQQHSGERIIVSKYI